MERVVGIEPILSGLEGQGAATTPYPRLIIQEFRVARCWLLWIDILVPPIPVRFRPEQLPRDHMGFLPEASIPDEVLGLGVMR